MHGNSTRQYFIKIFGILLIDEQIKERFIVDTMKQDEKGICINHQQFFGFLLSVYFILYNSYNLHLAVYICDQIRKAPYIFFRFVNASILYTESEWNEIKSWSNLGQQRNAHKKQNESWICITNKKSTTFHWSVQTKNGITLKCLPYLQICLLFFLRPNDSSLQFIGINNIVIGNSDWKCTNEGHFSSKK